MATLGVLSSDARTSRARRTQETSSGGRLHEDKSFSRSRQGRALDSWNGFTAETGRGSVQVGVSYILNGNTVIIRKMGEADIYYGLY